MKLTGSLTNRVMENSIGENPVVGMGCTECLYTDRHPYEIIEVVDDRHLVVRSLDAKRTDTYGMSEIQNYEYKSNPDGVVKKLFRTQTGVWRERIGSRGLGHNGWYIGTAEEYYDYSF